MSSLLGFAVDISRKRGMLLLSSAPGSLAGPTGSSGSESVTPGGVRIQPPRGRRGRQRLRGSAAQFRLDRGLGVEGARAPSRQRRLSSRPAEQAPVRRCCPGPFPYHRVSIRLRLAVSGTAERAGTLSQRGASGRDTTPARGPGGRGYHDLHRSWYLRLANAPIGRGSDTGIR